MAVADLATITTGNAPAIASGVMAAALEGGDLGAFTGFSGSAPVASGGTAPVLSKIGTLSADRAETLLKSSQLNMTQAAVEAPIEECPMGGFVDVSATLANAETLTPGDTITFVYVDCNDGLVTIDGTFAMSITSFSGDFVAGSFSFGVTVQLTNFSVTEGDVSSVAAGTLSMSMDATAAPSMSITISATSLSITANGATNTLSDFSVVQTLDSASGLYSRDASGSLSSSQFSGQVDFTTTLALQGVDTGFAFEGELLITGAEGATIRVVVLSESMVRLEVDTNGDGTPEDSIDTDWSTLA